MFKKEQIEALRFRYPVGTRIELLQMDDPAAPPVGTKCTVTGIDDIGDIWVDWDNGSSLNVVPEQDQIAVCDSSADTIQNEVTDTIRKQILAIRESGRTNMFDVNTVQRLAYEQDFYELVLWLEGHRKEYARFILTGQMD